MSSRSLSSGDCVISYATWEAKLTPSLIDNLRRHRGSGSQVRRSWYVDHTYIKVNGRLCYLYRAIDRTGALWT
jgi:transposase-like protein